MSNYDAATLRAFGDELEKLSILGAVGRGVLKAGRKFGPTQKFTESVARRASKAMGSQAGGQKLIGGATLGAGALGAGGYLMGRRKNQGQNVTVVK